MPDAVSIAVEPRDPAKNKGTGSRIARRLRANGRIPAIIYGHKQEPVPISLANEDVAMMLKKHIHLAELSWNGTKELTLVKDVQWDHLGKDVLHLDFLRVSAGETVESEVALELHGEPEGLVQGGQVEQFARTLTIQSEPASIPSAITVEISHLQLGEAIYVRDLIPLLPKGVRTEADENMLIVHVVEKKTAAQEEAEEAAAAEAQAEAQAAAEAAEAEAEEAESGESED